MKIRTTAHNAVIASVLVTDSEDNPEVLTTYGFNVVVGSAKAPTKTPAAAKQAK